MVDAAIGQGKIDLVGQENVALVMDDKVGAAVRRDLAEEFAVGLAAGAIIDDIASKAGRNSGSGIPQIAQAKVASVPKPGMKPGIFHAALSRQVEACRNKP